MDRSHFFHLGQNAMRTSLHLLNDVQVASPCHVDWNEMVGNDQARFCGQCEKQVYNLSEMTAQQAIDLVREKEGKLCVRFYRRHDGTMLTADCPIGLHHRIPRRRRLTGVMATVASLFLMSGCAKDQDPGTTTDQDLFNSIIKSSVPPNDERCITGEMVPQLQMIQGGMCPPKELLQGKVAAPPGGVQE